MVECRGHSPDFERIAAEWQGYDESDDEKDVVNGFGGSGVSGMRSFQWALRVAVVRRIENVTLRTTKLKFSQITMFMC